MKKVTLAVKVVPKSSTNEIVGWEGDELKIRLKGVPEKGQVNEELISFLAKTLKLAKSQVQLISGHKSRHKKVLIDGIARDDLGAFFPHSG